MRHRVTSHHAFFTTVKVGERSLKTTLKMKFYPKSSSSERNRVNVTCFDAPLGIGWKNVTEPHDSVPITGWQEIAKNLEPLWSWWRRLNSNINQMQSRVSNSVATPHAQSCWCQCSVCHWLCTKQQCSLWLMALKGYHWEIIGEGISHQSEERKKIKCWHSKNTALH